MNGIGCSLLPMGWSRVGLMCALMVTASCGGSNPQSSAGGSGNAHSTTEADGDASLSALVPSAATLQPSFAPGTTSYTLTLPPGVTRLRLTPSVTDTAHATIHVNGAGVTSGSASAPIVLSGFAPLPIAVRVEAGGSASATYTIVVVRSSRSLEASNQGVDDRFGASVALSADGSTLAVGADREASNAIGVGGDPSDNSASRAGAVYVFTRSGATWAQQAYLKASNTDAGDGFGASVALSADGSTLAIGAPHEDSSARGVDGRQRNNGNRASGAVYVFTRSETTWAQQAYIKASRSGFGNEFGGSVALSADGSTLAIGAMYENSSATGIGGHQGDFDARGSGAVYVFTRSHATWSQQAYIKASNAGGPVSFDGGIGDGFGNSVALSADGSTLAVGAMYEYSSARGVDGDQTDNSTLGAGAVYVFTRSGATWAQRAYLKASNTDASDGFGQSVTLSSDGATLAVGAPGERSSATGVGGSQADNSTLGAGAVYVFTRSSATWAQRAYLKASHSDVRQWFGNSVTLSSDGATLAVGAWTHGPNAPHVSGSQADNRTEGASSVYVFTRSGATWSQQAYVEAPHINMFSGLGRSTALSADASTLVIGAPGEGARTTGVDGSQANDSTNAVGAVYVY